MNSPTPDSIPDGCSDPGEHFAAEREQMVHRQLRSPGRDIRHPLVLSAMAAVPRHEFVPANLRSEAYADHPLPIGLHQTISQPYIVALMTESLAPQTGDRVLEIGTGSGYQTAVLARIVREIHTLEILPRLAECARALLHRLGIRNAVVHEADGAHGWPEAAPYDGILVACAPRQIPRPLIEQLREGGRLVIPVGDLDSGQELLVLRKHRSRMETRSVLPVRFVPMTAPAHRPASRRHGMEDGDTGNDGQEG